MICLRQNPVAFVVPVCKHNFFIKVYTLLKLYRSKPIFEQRKEFENMYKLYSRTVFGSVDAGAVFSLQSI